MVRSMSKIGIVAVLFILFTSVGSVQAQAAAPQVEISCTPLNMTFDVYPGATNITAETICTIANPTSNEEKIELNESHGTAEILVEFAGGNVVIDVPANSEVNVTITITASEGAESASHDLEITATVIELNGTPPPNVASDSDDIMVTFNAYDDYTVVCNDPIVISINSDYQHPNKFDYFSISNNGNYNTMLRTITTDLDEVLAPYNMSLSIDDYVSIASNESEQLSSMLGAYDEWYEVNKSSWEVLDNGTRLLYINSTILFETVHPPSICIQCNQTVDLNFEIYYVQIESNSGVEETTDEEDKAVPGFELSTGILSIVCAVMIANRKLGRIE